MMKVIPIGAECIVINGAVEYYAWEFNLGERVIFEGGDASLSHEKISKLGNREIWQYASSSDLKVVALPITKRGHKLKHARKNNNKYR